MLNTVMALWNQHPGENRQRIVKLLFTFLFISGSIFLLLFTLNSSAWSSVPGKERIQAKKAVQVRMSNHNAVATAGNTPVRAVVAGITPVATRTRVCVHTPTVVVQPSVAPQNVEVYSVNNSLEHKSSKPRHVRPKVVHVRKDIQPPRKRAQVKIIVTPVSQETIIVISSPPAPAMPQPIITPVVTATAVATPVPVEGTAVSSAPDIVTINVTPDLSTSSTDPFTHSLRQRGAIGIPVSPMAKKSTTKRSKHVYEYVKCGGSTTHKDGSVEIVLKGKRRIGLLLGASLLGAVLFCRFMFVRKREEYATFLKHFKISSKNA
jgi:hypothetical protein